MPLIVETIVTTLDGAGQPHIAPLGLIAEGDRWGIAPFKPSRTLDNLRAHPFAVASHPADVRVFAGCVTGRKSWPVVAADKVKGTRLADAVSHWELAVDSVTEDATRPRFHCRRVHVGNHAAWGGYNRAQGAVLELAVLVTRLGMLPRDKVENELKYLEIAIAKTAGPAETEAWGWLMAKVEAWRAAAAAG
jgi:hypothetical protein